MEYHIKNRDIKLNTMKIKLVIRKLRNLVSLILISIALFACSNDSPEIIVQEFQMELTGESPTFSEELLKGEIEGTTIKHTAFAGPINESISLSEGYVNIFIFIKGNGMLQSDSSSFQLEPESIAIPFASNNITIEVPDGDTLHFLQFTKELSEQDKEDMISFPEENKYDIYFTRFSDCEPYTEKIKSPNTTSRTVLPADIIPRVALGTVETIGPDEVGAHEHAMLDQLFLGLTDNDVTVHADGSSTEFKAYSLLHIPIGSTHWVKVDENKKMYYLWMDFFLTKEGQDWLKTHKPVVKDKKDY